MNTNPIKLTITKAHKKYPVFVFSTSLQLLIPLITIYCSLVRHPGSAFMALL